MVLVTAPHISVSRPPTKAVLLQATAQALGVRLLLEGLVIEPPIPAAGVSTLAATHPQGSSTSVAKTLVLSLEEEQYLIKTRMQ